MGCALTIQPRYQQRRVAPLAVDVDLAADGTASAVRCHVAARCHVGVLLLQVAHAPALCACAYDDAQMRV